MQGGYCVWGLRGSPCKERVDLMGLSLCGGSTLGVERNFSRTMFWHRAQNGKEYMRNILPQLRVSIWNQVDAGGIKI